MSKVMKKFAVILSGCGVYDGSEIHEAVLTMLAINKCGATYDTFAPDIMQHHVINHITGKEMNEKRNVLIESARIARGNIKPLTQFAVNDYDALVFPGGYGAAKNLSDYAFAGADLKVNETVAEVIKAMHKAGKPIGALCIAPVLIAKVLGNVELTIGSDVGTAAHLQKLGAIHKNTTATEVIVDIKNKICTTPCYMVAKDIYQVSLGAENLIKAMLELC